MLAKATLLQTWGQRSPGPTSHASICGTRTQNGSFQLTGLGASVPELEAASRVASEAPSSASRAPRADGGDIGGAGLLDAALLGGGPCLRLLNARFLLALDAAGGPLPPREERGTAARKVKGVKI